MDEVTFKKFLREQVEKLEEEPFVTASLSSRVGASATSQPIKPLDWDAMNELIKGIEKLPPRPEFIESRSAVTPDGTRRESIRRSWKERLFSLPWRPWISHKYIEVTNYKPVIIKVGHRIIYHPSLKEQIRIYLTDG